jgi:Family of unknown function (DUF6463)
MLEVDLVRLGLGLLFLIGLWVLVHLRKRTAGRLLMLIGFLHILGGAWVGRGPLGRIVREGFFGEADSALGHVASQMDKELVFWFMLWGVVTGRTFQCGDGWQSNEKTVRFGIPSPRVPKEPEARCYASTIPYTTMIPLCNGYGASTTTPTP